MTPETRKPQPLDDAKVASLAKVAADADASVSVREQASLERGALYHRANRFDDAIALLRPLALGAASRDVAEVVVDLYLDSLHVSGTPCFGQLERDALLLRDHYCGPTEKQTEFCSRLKLIVVQIRSGRATSLAESDHAGAAALLAALFDDTCVHGADTRYRCDEIAYNAAISYELGGAPAKARAMLAAMKNPKNRIDKSPLTTRLDCVLTSQDAGVCTHP